jgi:hypothetical protein
MDANKLHPSDERGLAFARASIVYSLLLLEAAANTCVEHIGLGKTVHNEIDRLPILAKFDFYLRTRFTKRHIERGVNQIEWIKELKGLRDGIVHLKPHKVNWVGDPEAGMSAEAVRTRSLKVAVNPRFWSAEDAILVSRGVHGFLKYFFREKCKYRPKMVAALLFSESIIPGDDNHFYPCFSKETKAELQRLEIDLTYIKIAWA